MHTVADFRQAGVVIVCNWCEHFVACMRTVTNVPLGPAGLRHALCGMHAFCHDWASAGAVRPAASIACCLWGATSKGRGPGMFIVHGVGWPVVIDVCCMGGG